MSDYETIRAAVSVEKWAVDKVAACYKEEIDRQATIKKLQPDGMVKEEIDEDMRQYLTNEADRKQPPISAERNGKKRESQSGQKIISGSAGSCCGQISSSGT